MPAFSQQPYAGSEGRMQAHQRGMMHMWGVANDQEIDRSLDTLKTKLNLSASQVTSIRQLVQARRQSFQSIREQAKPKWEQLMALVKQPNPDPEAVGRAVLDLKGIHEQAHAKQNAMEKAFMAVLNPTQQQTVNNLREQADTYSALRRVGLLGFPEFPSGFTSGANAPGMRGMDEKD